MKKKVWLLAAAALIVALGAGTSPGAAFHSPVPPPTIWTVCPDGPPTCAVDTIQGAVDAASDGDVIKVAGGTYTGVAGRPAPPDYPDPPDSGMLTQVVYIDKSVTIRGGYSTDFTDPPDPKANPSTLDAQRSGRVLFITGDVDPTIEGLDLTGGDAFELGGHPWEWGDAGGGVYILNAMATLRDNSVFENTAEFGAGLYLVDSDATFSDNTIATNAAATDGGGLVLFSSDITFSRNAVVGNTAANGAGLYLHDSGAIIDGNTVTDNIAVHGGGGLFLDFSPATLDENLISANAADRGGGLFLTSSPATLRHNTVSLNTASRGAGYASDLSAATLIGNTFSDNAASHLGGGIHLSGSNATLINNIVADNQAGTTGSGLYIDGSSPLLLFTTIARNGGGDGSGVLVTEWDTSFSAVALYNTILVGHQVGIEVTAGNMASLAGTLWGSGDWANSTDWGGDGTVFPGLVNLWGDPDFADPDAGDYHIGPDSAAIDAGVDAGVEDDIDGQTRPYGDGYDIGADEYWTPLLCPTVLDDFNRPGRWIGSNWQGQTQVRDYQIIDQHLDVELGGPLYWNPEVYGPVQDACITLLRLDSVGERHSLLLKVQADGNDRPTWQSGAIAVSYDPTQQEVIIESVEHGKLWVRRAAFALTLQDRDRLGARALADGTVQAYVNGALVGTADGGSFFADKGGRIGMWMYSTPDAILDDFAGP